MLRADVAQGVVQIVNCSTEPVSFVPPLEAGTLTYTWTDEEGVAVAGGFCLGATGVDNRVPLSLAPGQAWTRACGGLRSIPENVTERWALAVEASIEDGAGPQELRLEVRLGEKTDPPCR